MNETSAVSALRPALENLEVKKMMRKAQSQGCIAAHWYMCSYLFPEGKSQIGVNLKMCELWEHAESQGYCVRQRGIYFLTAKGRAV